MSPCLSSKHNRLHLCQPRGHTRLPCLYPCRVVVGGGKPLDAAGLLVLQPVLWAAAVGLALNALAMPLPGSLAAVAAALAPANKPLMLLSAGMLLQPVMPQSRQVSGEMGAG